MKINIKKTAVGVGATLVLVGSSVAPVFSPETVTVNEYQQIVQMYNMEIQRIGGIDFVVNDGKTLKALNVKLREVGISAESEELIRKAESSMGKRSLFDKIIQ